MKQIEDVSQAFKIRDAASYDRLTEEFDLFSRRSSQPLAARVVSLARILPSERVLDVGTGTGIVAWEAARKVGTAGKILGIDLSEGMLQAAKAKAVRAGLAGQVEFARMDAEALVLRDRSFDVVVSLFALLHFPNPLAALGEMFRVLRPGGRIVLAVGSSAPLLSLTGLIQAFKHLHHLTLTWRGRLLTAPGFLDTLVWKWLGRDSEPEETGLAHHGLSRPRHVLALVRRAGFVEVRSHWLRNELVVESPEAFWEMQSTFSSFARKRLANAPSDLAQAVRDEFLSRCRDVQARGGRLVYPFGAFYVVARRPRSQTK